MKSALGAWPWRRLLGVALVGALVLAAFRIPIPAFVLQLPGPARDVQHLVVVTGAKTYPSTGKLLFTTVSFDLTVSLADWVGAAFDPNRAVIDRSSLTGGASLEELAKQEKLAMTLSKRHAEEVVLARLGYGRPTGDGVKIVRVQSGSPAQGEIRAGDVIRAVGGRRADTTCDVGRIVGDSRPGESIRLTLVRDGRRRSVGVKAGSNPASPGDAYLGILMRDIDYEFNPEVDVSIRTGAVGGPSAGLVFALTLYDKLTPGDLTGGRTIAGTGEISCDGDAGPIGGVEEKVAGAAAEGATVFLSPTADYEAAKGAAPEGLEVVAVSSFDDALDYLSNSRAQ
ncbi:PDZ domain-containing protein [soil metagenome]